MLTQVDLVELRSNSFQPPCWIDGGGLPEFHGVGWGGVGMLTFLAHAHMFDATQQDVSLGLAHMFDAWGLRMLCNVS